MQAASGIKPQIDLDQLGRVQTTHMQLVTPGDSA
jgi:hypothetical protein